MITVDEYMTAERRLELRELRKGWRVHATVYALVITGLVVLNLVIAATTEDDFLWFFFPLVGWGTGVYLHYLHAVRWADREVRAWQERVQHRAETHR